MKRLAVNFNNQYIEFELWYYSAVEYYNLKKYEINNKINGKILLDFFTIENR